MIACCFYASSCTLKRFIFLPVFLFQHKKYKYLWAEIFLSLTGDSAPCWPCSHCLPISVHAEAPWADALQRQEVSIPRARRDVDFSTGRHVRSHLEGRRPRSLTGGRTARSSSDGPRPLHLPPLRVNTPTLCTLTLDLLESTALCAAGNKDGRQVIVIIRGAGAQQRSEDLENINIFKWWWRKTRCARVTRRWWDELDRQVRRWCCSSFSLKAEPARMFRCVSQMHGSVKTSPVPRRQTESCWDPSASAGGWRGRRGPPGLCWQIGPGPGSSAGGQRGSERTAGPDWELPEIPPRHWSWKLLRFSGTSLRTDSPGSAGGRSESEPAEPHPQRGTGHAGLRPAETEKRWGQSPLGGGPWEAGGGRDRRLEGYQRRPEKEAQRDQRRDGTEPDGAESGSQLDLNLEEEKR